MTRIAVLGAGSWGSTFSLVLADAGREVVLWARREETAREIREHGANPAYLGDVRLPGQVTSTSEVGEALDGADGVVLALPAQSLRENLSAWRAAGLTLPEVPVLSLAKGIERGTDLRMSQVIVEAAGVDPQRVAVLSGPNLAVEIARRQPCASVIAAHDEQLARTVAAWCAAPSFRPYTSQDVIGVEVAGAVKNVIAIAVGAAAGLGYGDNARASLITRGLAEITRLGVAVGGQAGTFAGLAGMGDLVATCASPLSRNHRLGHALGRGLDVGAAVAEVGQTAEGVATARAVDETAQRLGIDMPITRGVVDVVDHGVPIEQVTTALLARSVRPE
ncbi:NAD(P)-dependent glycerol-3-phosphate dehydrogenase [Brachybacterium halotolerans subsp. kimchii]|uniref:NAD(P)H-dependent glycerol-3-phosphate dehydrogenase n=1 Tax=Brachybacterium halotolerans TaxID=2795215 RepID=UPI001E5441B6|nr:NAD(P)H-dependent glycerol-3-phosphate dehydrogenase [Brachybacterium halotolerans]UEJ82974.1 NAD(P)-dependent glycerol-3-phosphate dehydrogenase [Brachybacterium halotolerans subsp. kimchii]